MFFFFFFFFFFFEIHHENDRSNDCCAWGWLCMRHASRKVYRICSIRRRGYCLFHRTNLCGFYSRAATNRERCLLNSVFSVKFFVIAKALRKASFIRRIAMQLDQPPLATKRYLHGTSYRFLPMISHDDRPPCLKKRRTSLDSVRSCIYRVLIWYCHLSPRFVHVGMCYSNISRG